MARHLLNLFLATSLGLLTSCGSSPADESTGSAHSNAKGLRVLGSLLSGVSQRELSVLSGTTSAYCGANCQEGYSAGNRGAQQCLNELPAAIPRVALNTLLEQGVRVLSTSEQRRMRMPDLPDPGVSWARWRVTCFYAAVLVEGRADVIDGFVQEYQRPIDMSPSAGADADDPFTRLGRAIEQLRGAFPSESQAPAPADSSSTTGMSSSNPDKPPAQEGPVFTEQGLDLVRQVRVGMRQEETEAIMGTPVERAYERTAAVSFYCQTGGFSDDVVAIFFRAQYADRQALVSESPGVYTVVSTLRYMVTLDDVGGETGDCAGFVRKGGYRPPAWLPESLR